jgi:hypothetical protein
MGPTNEGSVVQMCRRSSGCIFCVGLALLASSRTARAQEDANSADIAAARVLAVDGVKLADAGRCAEAIDKLARAEKLHHAPIVLGRLGECQIGQGKLLDGTESLRKMLREPLAANAPAAVSKARDRAQAVLDAAKGKIAAVTISLTGARDDAVTVTIDGEPVPAALLDVERPADPGEHFIEASGPGLAKASARVVLGVGEKQTVALKLVQEPTATPPSPVVTPVPPPLRAVPPPESTVPAISDGRSTIAPAPDHTGAYISWAIGGAALVGGGIFGLVAIKDKSDLDKDCSGNVCPESSRSRLDSASRAGTISTVLFAAGGAGVALGTILFFTTPSASPPAPAADRRSAELSRTGRFRAEPWIGIGQVGFNGEF